MLRCAVQNRDGGVGGIRAAYGALNSGDNDDNESLETKKMRRDEDVTASKMKPPEIRPKE